MHWLSNQLSIILLVLVIVAGCLTSIGHIWYQNIPYMLHLNKMESIFEELFYSIWYTWPFIHHIAPFTLGILVAFLIRRYPDLYFGGIIGELLLTIVFIGLSFLGYHWTQSMTKSTNDWLSMLTSETISTWEIYLNISIGKLMFCAGFMWIFYLCCSNRHRTLNKVLNIKQMQPFYNLSLGLYLTNFIPPLLVTFSTKELIDFDDFFIVSNWIKKKR